MQDCDLGTGQRFGLDAAMRRPHFAKQLLVACFGPWLEFPAVIVEKGVDQPADRQGGSLAAFFGLRV